MRSPGFSGRGKRLRWMVGGSVLISLLAGSWAGFATGSVELVSRANPRRLSDTAISSVSGSLFPAPSISADGRWVAFMSTESNLVAGQTNPEMSRRANVFLRDQTSGATTLVSHSKASPTATRGGKDPALSADGRWVAFLSDSTDLVDSQPANAFSFDRLFLYDRVSGTTSLVSPSAYLESNNGPGLEQMAISADGRFIAFTSGAPDLVPGQQDDNFYFDVFLYDRTTAKTSLVSHVSGSATKTGNGGSQDLSLSADGRFVAFASSATDLVPGQGSSGGVFLYDRLSGALRLIGPGESPAISAGGGSVLFFSADDHLATGQIDTNGGVDAFLYDRVAGTITLVSHAAGLPTTAANGESPAPFKALSLLSAGGRFVAFLSNATDLVPGQAVRPGNPDLFLYDRISGNVVLANRSGSSPTTPGTGKAEAPCISGDGRFVAFVSRATDQVPGQVDANSDQDVFLFDRNNGTTTLVSSANGSPTTTGDKLSYAPAISADGSLIAFHSEASNLQAGVKDLNGGDDTILYDVHSRSNAYATLHAPDQPSLTPALESSLRDVSGDGRYVLFESTDSNLVVGQIDANEKTDVFLYDHATGSSILVSRSTASPAVAGDHQSSDSVLSADGRYVAFASSATNLVAGVSGPIDPTTGQPIGTLDVFLFDRITGSTILVSRSATRAGHTGNSISFKPTISADGRWVAFGSLATDLVPGLAASSQIGNIYLYDRVTGTTLLVSRSNAEPLRTANASSGHTVLSADGRYVAYQSEATDLVPGQTDNPNLRTTDVFLFDRTTGTTALMSHTRSAANDAADGQPTLPSLSADGRYAVFSSSRGDLTDVPGTDQSVYLYDREGGALTLVSPAGGLPKISSNGRWVAFLSAYDLLPGVHNSEGYSEVYLYDRISKTLRLVTSANGFPSQVSQGEVTDLAISADGRSLAFISNASDLAPGQSGPQGSTNLYLYDQISGATTLASRTSPLPIDSRPHSLLSADGQSVAFTSFLPTLVVGDFNTQTDVFLYRAEPTPAGPVTLPPCALFDGVLRSNARKVLKVAGACGVPAGVKQVAVRLTVSQGTGKGNVQLYPGNVRTPSAGILRFERGATRVAGFTLPLSTNGTGTIALLPFVGGNGTVRVSVEVDGYTP